MPFLTTYKHIYMYIIYTQHDIIFMAQRNQKFSQNQLINYVEVNENQRNY